MKKNNHMNLYELVFILKEDKKEILDRIKQLIQSLNGEIKSEEKWGKKELAYKIKRLEAAYYYLFRFNLPKNQTFELRRKLNFDEDIVRYLLLKVN